ANGAQASNVFWQVGSSATIDVGAVMQGNILALTSITTNLGATLNGRALALNGAVTAGASGASLPVCQ
ncbi:MAG TPA: ice-binding family protein, partial [Candidatus Binataceae bacterium]|nr:ice-binding family protein [Candidatus Binataceae bacterium]